jgi:DNA repair protein RadC
MKSYPENKILMKHLAAEDRPREKLLSRGKKALTDAELLAILIGSGSREENALNLSQRILNAVEYDLNTLGRWSVRELMRFKGVGASKASLIAAALELGGRKQHSNPGEKPQIRSSKDAYICLAPVLSDLPHEEFWLLLLNRANAVLAKERISSGGIAGTIVDPKLVFRRVFEHSACSVILAHNHPSGTLRPSDADISLTKKLTQAADSLDVQVLDHLIVTERGYFSFADEGLL